MDVGSEVLIWGGISDLLHGQIMEIKREFTKPFAIINLRRMDGKLSAKTTLVPLDRCHTLPAHVLALQEAEREAWLKKWSPKENGDRVE